MEKADQEDDKKIKQKKKSTKWTENQGHTRQIKMEEENPNDQSLTLGKRRMMTR